MIEGVQAHGAMPRTGVVAAKTLIALQQLVARNIDLTRGMGVITVGKLVSGETANVMAGRASMLGTMRANDMAIRNRMLERLPQVVEGTALASGAKAYVQIAESYPVTVNNAELARESIAGLRRFGVDAEESAMATGVREHIASAMRPVVTKA